MAKSRTSRLARNGLLVALLAGLLVIFAGGWWIRSHRIESRQAIALQRDSGSAAWRTEAAGSGGDTAASAKLTITVSDERGPLRDAVVRLMPSVGELVVVKTGADGVAHADRLEPGTWRVSASADGHLPAALPPRPLAPGSTDHVALNLVSGGRTLRGTVSDTSGGPVAGALIEAAKLTLAAMPADAVSTAIASEDGTYRMTVSEGSLLVAVTGPDYAPQSRRIEVGPAGAVANFSLVPGGVVEGVVKDERTQAPVAGASVRARRTPGVLFSAQRRVTAGPDGRFRITGLKPGDWQLDAAAPPRYSRSTTHVGLAVAEQVSDVELWIGDSAAIRGRVVDEAGTPAPGAEVRAVIAGGSSTALADAAGNFVMRGLRPGNYVLSASSTRYLRAGGTSVSLADQDVDGVVVRVKRGLVLTGHVEPRQPCHVLHEFEVSFGRSLEPVPDALTGADGEFTLRPFDSGPARLVARCASGDAGELSVQIAPGMPDAVIPVAPGASLTGRVVDRDGKPVPGVSVVANGPEVMTALDAGPLGGRFRMSGGIVTSGAQTLTDAAGAFQIDGLAAGPYRFDVLDRGKPLRQRNALPAITLATSEHRTGIELQVELARGVIAGTVTRPDGTPLADAWVSAYPELSTLDLMNLDASELSMTNAGPGGAGGNDPAPPPVLTDAQGRYALTGLFHLRYTIIAEGQRGQLRARQPDVVPDATLNLETHGVSTLSGTVMGAGPPGTLITVALRGPTMAERSFTQGVFTFDHIAPGDYTVHVESLVGGGSGRVTVEPGESATLDIALSVNGTVTGRLVDGSGKPLGGMTVVVVRDDNGPAELIRPPATTAADGRFRIDHAAGACLLFVDRQPQRPFIKRGLVIESGRTLELGAITLDASPDPSNRRELPRAAPPDDMTPAGTKRRASDQRREPLAKL